MKFLYNALLYFPFVRDNNSPEIQVSILVLVMNKKNPIPVLKKLNCFALSVSFLPINPSKFLHRELPDAVKNLNNF